jgi:hypothetical protein
MAAKREKRVRIKALITITVPLGRGMTTTDGWRKRLKKIVNEQGDMIWVTSVKPYADPKVYPKERSAAARNREWLTGTVEDLE